MAEPVGSPPPGEPTAPRLIGLGSVMLAVTFLGVGTSIVKWAEQPGSVVGLWRLLVASGLWWIIVAVRRRLRGVPLPPASTWRRVAPAGVFFGVNLSLVFTAVTKTSIAHAEFIMSLAPVFLVPAGALLFGERPHWRALRWGVLSFAGLAIVLGFGHEETTATLGGDLLMVAALAGWIGYMITTKRARRTVGVTDFMACAMPIAVLTCAPIAFAMEGDAVVSVTGRGWIAIVLLAVLTGIFGHGLIVVSHRYVTVATIGVVQVAQPAMAVLWAYVLLGEQVAVAQLPGMAMIVVALGAFSWVSQPKRSRRKSSAARSPASTGA